MGTMNFSVTTVVTRVTVMVEAKRKNQLMRGWVGATMFIPLAADSVIPAKRASVPATKKLAVNPPQAAANPAMIPTAGLRPRALKTAPPMAGVKMMPASEARLALMPTRARTAVTMYGGAPRMVFRIRAEMKPVCSTRPMPSIMTMISPRGAKEM